MKIPCRDCGEHDLSGKDHGYMAYMICLHVPREKWAEAVAKCPADAQETIKAYLRKQWRRFGNDTPGARTTVGG